MSKKHKHECAGTEAWCHARGCRNRIEWGTRKWTARWVSVWVESERQSFDACSMGCAEKIETGSYVVERKLVSKTREQR